ncbi:MAG TPA: hypothetical protein VGG29_04725 [Caulobacteraceae bacterium]|jgi:hypothetical protein
MTRLAMPTRRNAIQGGVSLFASGAASTAARAVEFAPASSPQLFYSEGRYLPFAPMLAGAPDQYRALIGDERGAFALHPRDGLATSADLAEVHAQDAVEAIVAAAKDRRVVILNEAHNISRCRLFALQVAAALRPLGFDVFAAETFQSDPGARFIETINVGAPITTWCGTYTADPVYAETVRACRRLGYRMAPYEAVHTGGLAMADRLRRERDEAANLQAVIAAHPLSRVFVYCGYGHASKLLADYGFEPMAMRLQAQLREPVLTVDQSWGAPAPDPKDTPPLVQALLARLSPDRPMAVTYAGAPLQPNTYAQGAFDIDVLHPALPSLDGRPGWLARAPDRRRVEVALPNGAPTGALAQAVPLAELDRERATVPADQYPIVDAPARALVFWLRPGRYLARLETPDGFTEVARVDV